MRLSLYMLLLAAAAPARAEDYGSSAYIISMFPFPEAGQVRKLQADSPFGPGAQSKQLPCPGDEVLPATPGQFTKKYHVDASVQYDHFKIPGDREGSPPNGNGNREGIFTNNALVCKVAQPTGSRRPDGSKWCLAPRTGRYVLMSDLFYCTNGKDLAFYRGYWEGADLLDVFGPNPMLNSENEHILTTSLGRGDSNYVPKDQQYREFVAGHTFSVKRKRFLFFTEATQEDILAIDKVVSGQSSPNSMYVRCADGTFAVRTQGCPK